jgi:rhodanese-related sulfurtransferase
MNIDQKFQRIKVPKLKPKEMEKMINERDYYILDVRPLKFERDASFIQGARLCPLVLLADKYSEIPQDKKIIITDWAMKQSPSAAKFLITKGYTLVGVLQGGMERWKTEKLPYVKRAPSGKVDFLGDRIN